MANKILLIDSDKDLTTTLNTLLQQEGFEVTSCFDGICGLQQALEHSFDLILLDVVLPEMNGFELLKQLRPTNRTPVMIISSRDDHFDRIYALEIGADDYLAKPLNNRELVARINAMMRRVRHIDNNRHQNILHINEVELSLTTRQVHCNGSLLDLTGSEFQVLYYLMANAGKVIAKDQIGESVLGRKISYYDRSIDMHISNIRKKLSVAEQPSKIKTIRGAGYIFLRETA
ncbi:response regulator transcription factor [Thalassotalea fusca]